MKPLFPSLLILIASLPSGGCWTAEGAPANQVPGVVFPALCKAFFEQEAFISTTEVVVLRETRPIFRTLALRELYGVGEPGIVALEQDEAYDEELKEGFEPTSVKIQMHGADCNWLSPKGPDKRYFGTDELMLELSNVVEDPFAPTANSQFGVFARLSTGGAFGAAWYWVALKGDPGSWEVSAVSRLPISDG